MLAVASLKRSLEFDPVEQGAKRKRAELKLSPPSSPVSSAASAPPLPSTTATTSNTATAANFAISTAPSSPVKQPKSLFAASPTKKSSLVLRKPCSLTALNSTPPTNDDIPMFNYAQTAQICARLLREQDRSIREQYEHLLTEKLTEQYDTFIRYTHDSVHRNTPKKTSSIRLFQFVQPQETNSANSSPFSYVS